MITDQEFKIIQENLRKYDKLNEILSKFPRNPKKFDDTNKREFTIFGILLSEQEYWTLFLQKLNSLLEKQKLFNNKKAKVKLIDNVFNFLSELEFGHYLNLKGVELEPEIKFFKENNFDFKIKNKDIFIEVTTPKLTKKDLDSWMKKAQAVPITMRIEDTVLNKIDQHNISRALENGFNQKLILLILGEFRGLDKITILATVNLLNENFKEDFKGISGIILKKWNRMYFFENEFAENKLSEDDKLFLSNLEIQTKFQMYND